MRRVNASTLQPAYTCGGRTRSNETCTRPVAAPGRTCGLCLGPKSTSSTASKQHAATSAAVIVDPNAFNPEHGSTASPENAWQNMPKSKITWEELRRFDDQVGKTGPVYVFENTPLETDNYLDDFTISVYSTGGCHVMAAALHERTGWPVVALGENECYNECEPENCFDYDFETETGPGEWCECKTHHFLVASPNGMLWDVHGPAGDVETFEDNTVRYVPDVVFNSVLASWGTDSGWVEGADRIADNICENEQLY